MKRPRCSDASKRQAPPFGCFKSSWCGAGEVVVTGMRLGGGGGSVSAGRGALDPLSRMQLAV